MVLNEASDLRSYLCAIPSHDQALANGPARTQLVIGSCGYEQLSAGFPWYCTGLSTR